MNEDVTHISANTNYENMPTTSIIFSFGPTEIDGYNAMDIIYFSVFSSITLRSLPVCIW